MHSKRNDPHRTGSARRRQGEPRWINLILWQFAAATKLCEFVLAIIAAGFRSESRKGDGNRTLHCRMISHDHDRDRDSKCRSSFHCLNTYREVTPSCRWKRRWKSKKSPKTFTVSTKIWIFYIYPPLNDDGVILVKFEPAQNQNKNLPLPKPVSASAF